MRDLASRRWLLANQTIGERRETPRTWVDGTYCPPRAPGYPTIYQMPMLADVPRRVPRTYLEIAGLLLIGAVVVVAVGIVVAAVGF